MALAARAQVEPPPLTPQERCGLDDDPALAQRLADRVRQGGVLKNAAVREGVAPRLLHDWLMLGRDPRHGRSRPVHVAFARLVDVALAEFAEAGQNQLVRMAFGVRAPPPKKGEPRRAKPSFPALKMLLSVVDPETYGLRARGGLPEPSAAGIVINVLGDAPRGALDATPRAGRGYVLPEALEDVD